MATTPNLNNAYLSKVESLARNNKRYLWLTKYLQHDEDFLSRYLYPVLQGHTRTVVVDFSRETNIKVPVRSFVCPKDNEALGEALATRTVQTQVRLIFVTSISGVGDEAREQVCRIQITETCETPSVFHASLTVHTASFAYSRHKTPT